MVAVNEGYMDRASRMSAGIAMMALVLSGTVTGGMGPLLLAIGAISLVTGIVGRCPLYRVLGWNTHHPHHANG